MFPTGPIVTFITQDRLREAENARLARAELPQRPRRAPQIRALASRVAAFSTLR
jgi:hypothetical protein